MTTASYAQGPNKPALLEQTIGHCLDEAAGNHPDIEALVSRHQDLRYTYAEFQEETDRVARALMAFGIQHCERVGIWAPNCAEWCITQFATAKMGAILVNINPAYRTSELEYALTHSGVSTLITQGAFKTSNYVEMLCELEPGLIEAEPAAFQAQRMPQLKHVICLDADRSTPGMWTWEDLREQASRVSVEQLAARRQELDRNDVINIQYTSGTTGRTKGASLTHRNILNNGFFVAEGMNIQPGDGIVIPVPLYHCFGMVMGNLGAITHGATIIYPNDGFDPQLTLEAVQAEQANALYGVPTMFIAELELPDFDRFDLSSLRTGIMA